MVNLSEIIIFNTGNRRDPTERWPSTFELCQFDLLESTQARIFIYDTPGYDFSFSNAFKGRHHVTAFA